LARRDVREIVAGLSIRRKFLAIAMAVAALAVLVLSVALCLATFITGTASLSFTIVAAVAGIVAGFALSVGLQGIIAQPFDRLMVQIAELETARLEAEAASKAKSDFLASMSHELRTPLNAIIGFSDLMKTETLGPIGTRTYVDYAADINFSGAHLLEIINDILDVVRYEAGKMELKEEAVEVESVINEALRLVAPQARQGNVEFIWSPPVPALPLLYCDRVRLRQILLNILSNAVKFTRPGGWVEIRAEREAGLALVVKDSGIGIRPEDIARILTPFGQIAPVYARNQQGSGLGLTLTKALIERHGGHLSLDSAPGVGTTVRLVFPSERVMP
jgi:signal transduction histidine kinase